MNWCRVIARVLIFEQRKAHMEWSKSLPQQPFRIIELLIRHAIVERCILIFSKLNQWFKKQTNLMIHCFRLTVTPHLGKQIKTDDGRGWSSLLQGIPLKVVFCLAMTFDKKHFSQSHICQIFFNESTSKGRAWIIDSTTKEWSLQGNKGILINNRSNNITESGKVREHPFNVLMKMKWAQLVHSGRFCKHMSLSNTNAK